MSYQTGVVNKIREYGLHVVEVAGWQTRGSSSFNPGGVVCHWTADGATGELPSLRMLINGRSDLAGPLCNFGLARSGAVYIIAAGRANHAGAGGWRGLRGNSSVFGIEAENNGTQAWPKAQYDAYVKLCAALCDYMHRGPEWVCGHFEWAPGRKIDPRTIAMNGFRNSVSYTLTHHSTRPVPKGWLMALTDKQQQDVYNWTRDLHKALLDPQKTSGEPGNVPNLIVRLRDDAAEKSGLWTKLFNHLKIKMD